MFPRIFTASSTDSGRTGRADCADHVYRADRLRALVASFDKAAVRSGMLPVKVSDTYAALVREEGSALRARGVDETRGPLYRCVLPTRERLMVEIPGEERDFIGDQVNMPEALRDVLIHKYADRVLFLPTDRCAAHCQYCFRTAYLSDRYGAKPFTLREKVKKLVEYLRDKRAQGSEVSEVILSGGDPMVMAPKDLNMVLRALREDAKIAHIRIHSRAIVFSPQVYHADTCAMLNKWRARLVHHVVHPYELGAVAREYVAKLSVAGVRQYAQFPMLRGVNDHVEILKRLLTDLDELGIRPLSIFAPDPVKYSAPFRISLSRQFRLIDELFRTTPAWVHSVRYALDNPHGKVRKEDFRGYDQKGRAVFVRDNSTILYPDFPVELDVPGNLSVMLWRE